MTSKTCCILQYIPTSSNSLPPSIMFQLAPCLISGYFRHSITCDYGRVSFMSQYLQWEQRGVPTLSTPCTFVVFQVWHIRQHCITSRYYLDYHWSCHWQLASATVLPRLQHFLKLFPLWFSFFDIFLSIAQCKSCNGGRELGILRFQDHFELKCHFHFLIHWVLLKPQ